jgi:fatty acid desaturase
MVAIIGTPSAAADVDVRASMRCLPRLLQPFLTWVTGKPLRGQRPYVPARRALRLVGAVGMLANGVVFGAILLDATYALWLLLPLSWLMTTGALRDLYLGIAHHAAHDNLFRSRRANRAAGMLLTSFVLELSFDRYRESHLRHHSSKLAGAEDDDVLALSAMGIHPGLPRAELWDRLFRVGLLSPRFYARRLAHRLRETFVVASPAHRLLALVWHGGGLVLVWLYDAWALWLLVWLPPLLAFSQASLLANTACEHVWHVRQHRNGSRMQHQTVARFLGDPTPHGERGAAYLASWAYWWARLLFLHVPSRVAVLISDLPQHDLHHRRPQSDWANAAYVREQDLETAREGTYREVWGSLAQHIDFVFDAWRSLPDASAAGSDPTPMRAP